VVETAAEQERWILWSPVCLGLGIGIYFSLPAEPPLWLGSTALATMAALAYMARRRPVLITAALGIIAVCAGFSISQWRTATVAAPVLSRPIGPTGVSGRVLTVETFPEGSRITLDRPRIRRLAPNLTPHKVRLRLQGEQPALVPGDWVHLRAKLSPPPPPATPGAFDFQRQSYFRGLGAVGFAFGKATVTASGARTEVETLGLHLERLRQKIVIRVRASLNGPRGSVAAALITGVRSAIPADLMTAVRDAGLAHLLAISGLHIGLVAGILFFGLRGALALVPALALRYPIKKWAAAVAIAGALGYALIAGATVPTQRAFLMVGLVLTAVLFDRRGLSMRMVAWAAVIILILQPESLLGASFQLSFAAVTALVATFEVLRDRRQSANNERPAWQRRILLYLGGVALTTVIAGLATAPFAVFHFNRFAAYGLAANLVAVPVTALWIMPWAVGALLLMPFGLESIALSPMGWGIEIVIDVAETIAAWPGAVSLVPAMPVWGLAAVTIGGLWLCLWRRRWRFIGLAGVTAGMASLLVLRTPDVLVDGGGKLLAVRTGQSTLSLSSLRTARFNRDIWLRREGQREKPAPWPTMGPSADQRMTCDLTGCIYRTNGQVVALVRQPEALVEDCWIASVIVSVVPVRNPCPTAHTVIDRFDLWRDGGHVLWLSEEGVRVESVNRSRGNRPWVVRPRPRKTIEIRSPDA
jgi:competence protein ComEC